MQTETNPKFSHIVITGASSGIGEALALHYAQGGAVLSLTGQNAERLEAAAQACRAKGADVVTAVLNVTDRAGMERWLLARDDSRAVDLVIANAGISAGPGVGSGWENPEQVRTLFDVNVSGVFHTIDPLLPRMAQRGRGSVALMSSLASFRGWPGAPAYAASKAAVRVYGEGLRGALAGTGVHVHVICPGFVRSRMTDANRYYMPLLMDADHAASIIARGIALNRGRIAFPAATHFFAWLAGVLPDRTAQKILKNTPSKRTREDILSRG